jgi:tRNA (guanosine-2'-O-)-methyltransferase
MTERRQTRIRETLERRWPHFTLALDNVFDRHNVAAILRSCEAFGLTDVHLLFTYERYPKASYRASAGAEKWLTIHRHSDDVELVRTLRQEGFQVLGTGHGPGATPSTQVDLTRRVAVVLGNEMRGLSPDVEAHLDGHIRVPMQGMVPSLNVSVAAAVILYEAWRQREACGLTLTPALPPLARAALAERWKAK